MFVIEQHIPPAPAADSAANELKSFFEKQARVERFDLIQTFHACNQEEGKRVAAYVLRMKEYMDQLERLGYMPPQDLSVGLILNGITSNFAGFVRNYNMYNMGKTIGGLHAMLIEYEKGLPKKAETPQVMAIRSGKIQKANKKSLKAKGKGKAHGKGKDKQVYIPKPKNPKPKNPKPTAKEHPAKDDTCHHYKEVGHWKRNCHVYLAELLKKKKHAGTASSSGKMTRKPFPHRTERAIDLLRIIHTDVCGLLRHVPRQCASYFITFTDDYSRYGYVYLLKHKHEVFETLKVFKNELENQLGKTIKALRSDQGGDYISQEFKDYLKACGIVQQLTPPYTPQHNRVSERRNHTFLNMVRSMMNLITLPLSFWDYALESATRIPNIVLTKKALVKRDTPDKLQQRSVKCIFIGYPKKTLGYYFYFPPKNKIVVTSKIPLEVEGFEPPHEEEIPIRRSERSRRVPNRLCLNVEAEEHSLGDLNEPTSYKAAMLDPKSNKWLDAMNTEMQSMIYNKVWVLVNIPPNCKTVEKTFSPVADIRAIRILISIAAFYDYEIWQMDIKTAFLNGYLDEDIYMVQPEAFVDPKHPRKNPGEPHWTAVKNILKYLRNTKDMFLVYGGNPEAELRVDCYCDAGFETDKDDIKSQTGYVFVLNGGVVNWKSSKQSTIEMSAIEVEYIAASEAAMKAVWIRKFISGLGIVPTINEPNKMFCDNSVTLLIANESGVQRGARHYHRRYHYVRECIELGEIDFLKVHTDDNLADPFTKALPKGNLTQHARSIELRLASSFM
ncbi:retrotransposon protein, putative, ty1-copia subclass [Tanacetum coccineum]